MQSVFVLSSGWLTYRPIWNGKLPRLCPLKAGSEDSKVPFVRPKSGEEMFRRDLYALDWPGADTGKTSDSDTDQVPFEICRHWINWKPFGEMDSSLVSLWHRGVMPDEPPECVAYHIAVNHSDFPKAAFPVAGLPYRRVRTVLDAEFALTAEQYACLQTLQWTAESYRHHPALQGAGDTMAREKMSELGYKAQELYFWLLGDCRYDSEQKFYYRGADKKWWAKMAHYLWLVGRVGTGTYAEISGVIEKRCEKAMPDVADRLQLWRLRADQEQRRMAHVDGPEGRMFNLIEGDVAEE